MSSSEAERDEVWARAIRRKVEAVSRAYEQRDAAVRAAHADGVPITVIASAFGVRNRKGIYLILSAGEDER